MCVRVCVCVYVCECACVGGMCVSEGGKGWFVFACICIWVVSALHSEYEALSVLGQPCLRMSGDVYL